MNGEIKSKWLAALRSGGYRQGRDGLHTESGEFCCLGVLCDLAMRDGVVRKFSGGGGGLLGYVGYGGDGDELAEFSTLPASVQGWAGLSSFNPVIESESVFNTIVLGEYASLAELNDDGKSFAEIADLIEECL